MKYLSALLCLALFNGCGGISALVAKNPKTADEVEQQCVKRSDEFKNKDYWVAPTIWLPDISYWFLGTGNPKADTISLHFYWTGKDWLFLDDCYALGGKKLAVHVGDRRVGKYGDVNEVLLVKIPVADLEGAKESGLQLKFSGKRGSYQIAIPGFYIAGYLSWLRQMSA